MSYRLTLDGQNFTPKEWQDTTFSTGWDDDVYVTGGDLSLTFTGDAYEYLLGRYDASYCNTVEAKVYICDELRHTGYIFLSEAQIDRVRCTINVGVSDIDWDALVKNKVKQVYFLDQTGSSDGSTITAASATNITFHVVSTGVSSATASVCYSVFETLQFLIAAMTDDALAFASDYFDTGGEGENFMICTGQEISAPAVATNLAPGVSWNDVYDDLKNLFNLRLWVEVSGNTTQVRVEPFEYFRADAVNIELTELDSITESVNADKIYSTIKLGSRDYRDDTESPATSFAATSFQTWDSETFNIRGDCVTDNTLNIDASFFRIDSNSIENQEAGETDYNKDVFLVATDGTDTLQYDFLGDGNSYYNFPLTNSVVAGRWTDRIHNAAFSDRGDTSGDFSARPTADQTGFINGMGSVIKFNTTISDPAGAYDPATLSGVYTAPATGLYLFTIEGDFDITFSTAEDSSIEWVLECTNNLVIYEERRIAIASNLGATINYQMTQVIAVSAIIGDDIVVSIDFQNSNFPVTPDTLTEITWKDDSRFKIEGLLVGNSVPIQYSAQSPLTPEQYDAILAARDEQITLNGYKGWVKQVDYRPFGISGIELESVRID